MLRKQAASVVHGRREARPYSRTLSGAAIQSDLHAAPALRLRSRRPRTFEPLCLALSDRAPDAALLRQISRPIISKVGVGTGFLIDRAGHAAFGGRPSGRPHSPFSIQSASSMCCTACWAPWRRSSAASMMRAAVPCVGRAEAAGFAVKIPPAIGGQND